MIQFLLGFFASAVSLLAFQVQSLSMPAGQQSLILHLADGGVVQIWAHLQGAANHSDWLQIDLHQHQEKLRLEFDNRRRLRKCERNPKDFGYPTKLDMSGWKAPSDGVTIHDFNLNSSREIKRGCAYFSSNPSLLVRRRRSIIMSGTKWCGSGNEAMNHSDYGVEIEADMCCHRHDTCFENIHSMETRWGYLNIAPTTITHCKCDDEFLECLENAGTETAIRVGTLYFNVFKIPCFTRTQEKQCVKRSKSGSCLTYSYRDVVSVYQPQHYSLKYGSI
ncbi:unnamed protein product [Calicophoron daubneyi]|uniref:Phospholipase A2-like central domain-containing protein n=1 Tax=Calicophoron daubneyi TaxID=300641 RepID=A0AAV2TS64_CALDB